MFDRVYLGRPHNTTVNITQKPNDAADSSRLLKELTEKAEQEVYGATIIRLGAYNELKVIELASENRFYDNKRFVKILFELNGKRYDIICEADEAVINREVAQIICEDLCDKVSRFLYTKKL